MINYSEKKITQNHSKIKIHRSTQMIFKLLLCCVELCNCKISLFSYTDHINLLMKTRRSLTMKALVPSGHFSHYSKRQ